eukprot:2800003-Amphidinium_carterae.1
MDCAKMRQAHPSGAMLVMLLATCGLSEGKQSIAQRLEVHTTPDMWATKREQIQGRVDVYITCWRSNTVPT